MGRYRCLGKSRLPVYIYALIWAVSVVLFLAPQASAYFDRGPTEVDLGQEQLTLAVGERVTVTVRVDPESAAQLPGCGMAECPQTCGDKNCLDENGECMCAGLEYKTYYADIRTATSDASIATVNYANGVIGVTGVSPGTAEITVSGMLRQYRESSQVMRVTVTAGEVAAPLVAPVTVDRDSGAPETEAALVLTEPPVPSILPVAPTDAEEVAAEEKAKQPQAETESIRTIMSTHGPITFVPVVLAVLALLVLSGGYLLLRLSRKNSGPR